MIFLALALGAAPLAQLVPIAQTLDPSIVRLPGERDPSHLPYLPTVPGDPNPLVTQDNIKQTVCVKGWTKTVRPPVSYTSKIKTMLMKTLHLPGKASDYELDHELSLEDGGSPSSLSNLWMQPYAEPWGARTKDKIETLEKTLVCNGAISLNQARYELMTDWVAAYQLRIGK